MSSTLPPPHENSFIIGPAVIKHTHTLFEDSKTASCRSIYAILFTFRRYFRSMDLWSFLSASSSLKPSFLKSVKFDPSSVRRFLLSDNSRPVSISLSSNNSLRAATVYSSTRVGTWLLSFLATSRSNAFARVVLVAVFSLICLVKNSDSNRPPSNSHVVSCLSARICIESLNDGQSFVWPEKTSARLSLSSMPLLGVMLVRAVELGSGTLSHRNGARPR